jgi:hypothetical protein
MSSTLANNPLYSLYCRATGQRFPIFFTSAAGRGGMAIVFAPPTDPRYNAFDWETWHELDVLRRELAPRFAAKQP